ncbi:type VI secretion system contractile sheath large subunit [Methylomonas sp. MgM2]
MSWAQDLIADLEASNPKALQLAEIVSLAVRVDCELLRLARINLCPLAGADDEAELWLSQLVESRASQGFVFHPEVAHELRLRLASSPGLLNAAWEQVFRLFRNKVPAKIRLEEELTWRLLRDPNDPEIARLQHEVLRELAYSPNRSGVARWIIRAIPNLPDTISNFPQFEHLRVWSHLALGDVSIFDTLPVSTLSNEDYNFLLSELPRTTLSVRFVEGALEFGTITHFKDGQEISLPETRPLWLKVKLGASSDPEVVTLKKGEFVSLPCDDYSASIATIDGAVYKLDRISRDQQRFIQRNRVYRAGIEYDIEIYGAEKKIHLPFVMGVLADLSGQPIEPLPDVAERKFLEIDVDNFDERLKAMRPRAAFQVPNTLSGEGDLRVDITFESMEDFSPAAVIAKTDGLNQILLERSLHKDLLTRLQKNKSVETLVTRFLNDPDLSQELAILATEEQINNPAVFSPGLERFFNELTKACGSDQFDRVKTEFISLARQQQWPTVTPDGSEEALNHLIGNLDQIISEQLNVILHHEDFQRLEGTWRGLQYLVNNTETDEMLKIRVLNISKKELQKSLRQYKGAEWDQSPLFKKIYEEEYGTFGGEPYGCLVGDYYFDHSPADVGILGEMAKIGAAAHAPFLAGAAPSVLQMESWAELANPRDLRKLFMPPEYAAWRSLRESEDARYIGLTLPRILSRLPYGSKTDPIEEFNFEEDTSAGDNDKYTWMNAAYAMAVNINRAFKLYGWCARIRGVESGGAVEGLPAHIFPTDDGGIDMKCPTEIAISDRREAELAKSGFMPLMHRKNSDFAVFLGAQSLQQPAVYDDPDTTANVNLAARWPYLFATCRFAHYLKCIARDKIGSFKEREDLEKWLNHWIQNYVDPNPAASSEDEQARRPLAAAEVVIEDVEGNSGYYIGKFFLRPHYQLEGLTVSLRLVSKLPSLK